ncbi:MAG: hypothetical protein SX243_11690 [Acidobacteriota bacterium]|nr:hypothetical protein [Acidobacteriota bacterium]
MYQPKLLPCHIRALYLLKKRDGKPMTFHVRKAVEQYLEIHAEDSLSSGFEAPEAGTSSSSSRS